MFAEVPAAAWNAGIVGVLMGSCSAIAADLDAALTGPYGDWAEWSTVTLGGWAAIAPFLLGFGSVPAPMWTHVLIGLSVVTIASMQLVASRKVQMPSSTKPTAAE